MLQKPLGQAGILLGSPKREAKTKESGDAHCLSTPSCQAENILVGGRNKYWSRRQVLDESVNNMPLTKKEFFSKLRNCHKTEPTLNTHFYMQTHIHTYRRRGSPCMWCIHVGLFRWMWCCSSLFLAPPSAHTNCQRHIINSRIISTNSAELITSQAQCNSSPNPSELY